MPDSINVETFPPDLLEVINLIRCDKDSERAAAVTQYVASCVHPDFVCSLAMLDQLPFKHKTVLLNFFHFCAHHQLSTLQKSQILILIQPYIIAGLRPRS